ncbi:MAG: GAF domain-containing protein [Candidatus Omnitrophota bacterium]|nr:GAF domain-containing protein [bacterium]MBU3930435.1 GAF domain-containing protein [bacterium]MBU4122554.1 GAF domain-containing protein [bacterium]
MAENDLQKHLRALDEMCSRISFSLKENEVFSQILKRSCEILGAEGMSVLLVSADNDYLKFYAVEGTAKEVLRKLKVIPVNEGIAGWVFSTGKAVLLNDPYSHPKFLHAVDRKTGYQTRNIICVPLISRMKTIGVLEIVNKRSGNFSQDDMYFTQALAGIISIVIRNIALFTELTNKNNMIKSVLNGIPGGFISINKAGKILEFNTAAAQILGFVSSVQDMRVEDTFKMQSELVGVLKEVMTTGKTGNRLILNTRKNTGEKLIVGYGTILMKSDGGKVLGSGIIFQDLTKIQGLP